MNFFTCSFGFMSLGTFLGASLFFGQIVLASKVKILSELPIDNLRNFAEIFGIIKNGYVDHIEDEELLQYAIEGMLSSLDPHSTYLDFNDLKKLHEGTSGEFGGIGIEVTMENGFIKVVAPIDNTPAARSDIQSGDLIIRLNNASVKGLSLSEAIDIMRGRHNSELLLNIIRKGDHKPFKIKLTRTFIKMESVKHRMIEPGYGYIRISTFQSRTGDSLSKAINTLKENNNSSEL